MKIFNIKLTLLFSLIFWVEVYPQQILPLTKEEEKDAARTHLIYECDPVDSFVIYRGYLVRYNYAKRTPIFTIHCLSPNQISPNSGTKVKRSSSFFVDDFHLRNRSAINMDYKWSGYDRGHMVPAGDFFWNKLLKDETFFLTNISPQNPILNRGIWNYLEMSIRDKVTALNENVYIVTGTIFSNSEIETIGLNKVGVPNYFYKIIYFSQTNLMFAFMFDNNIGSYLSDLNDYQIKVDELERITGQDFFECLEDSLENKLESTILPFLDIDKSN